MRKCVYGTCQELFIPKGNQSVCEDHPCIVGGCSEKRRGTQYCSPHDHRYRRYGSPIKNGSRPPLCKLLNYYECGRIAAFIDGEGNISSWIDKMNRVNIHIGIANTNYRLMDYLIKTLGCGSVTSRDRGYPYKIAYEFRIKRVNDVLCLLEQIKDHLILKKEQAQLAIQSLIIRQSLYFKPTTDNENNIMITIQSLNKKGR